MVKAVLAASMEQHNWRLRFSVPDIHTKELMGSNECTSLSTVAPQWCTQHCIWCAAFDDQERNTFTKHEDRLPEPKNLDNYDSDICIVKMVK